MWVWKSYQHREMSPSSLLLHSAYLDGHEWVTREYGPLLWHVTRRHPKAEVREREKKVALRNEEWDTDTGKFLCPQPRGGSRLFFPPGWDVCVNRFRSRYQKPNILFVCYQMCVPRWSFPFQVWCMLFWLSALVIIYLKPKFRSNFKQYQLGTCQLGNLFLQE